MDWAETNPLHIDCICSASAGKAKFKIVSGALHSVIVGKNCDPAEMSAVLEKSISTSTNCILRFTSLKELPPLSTRTVYRPPSLSTDEVPEKITTDPFPGTVAAVIELELASKLVNAIALAEVSIPCCSTHFDGKDVELITFASFYFIQSKFFVARKLSSPSSEKYIICRGHMA
jgi:hypothetical protein